MCFVLWDGACLYDTGSVKTDGAKCGNRPFQVIVYSEYVINLSAICHPYIGLFHSMTVQGY